MPSDGQKLIPVEGSVWCNQCGGVHTQPLTEEASCTKKNYRPLFMFAHPDEGYGPDRGKSKRS